MVWYSKSLNNIIMLIDVNYAKIGALIEEILDIVKPLPEDVVGEKRDKIDEWRQMYVMSSHFAQWDPEKLKKFLERVKGQKEKGEKIEYMNFSNL
jgi:DNA-directed RNA polymerase subunit F